MKLYIGGANQGQEELARRENPDCEIIADFHEIVRAWMVNGISPIKATENLIAEHPQAIIVSNEIGSGVVPIDREDRRWREQVGRTQCILAAASDQVTRVICGIGVRIK